MGLECLASARTSRLVDDLRNALLLWLGARLTPLRTHFVADLGRIPTEGTTLPGLAGWRGYSPTLDYKVFALRLTVRSGGNGTAYKYGELPPFGVPVPQQSPSTIWPRQSDVPQGPTVREPGPWDWGVRVLSACGRKPQERYIGRDHWRLRNGQRSKEPDRGTEQRQEGNFFHHGDGKQIKTALPQGLLINRHNPLLALHGALSVGLHGESDDEVSGVGQCR